MRSARARMLSISAFTVLVAAAPLKADHYWVDRTDDGTAGGCSTAPNDCPLRRAILLANANPGNDVVHLGEAVYTLTIAGPAEDEGLAGDLDVTDGLTILGLGPERTLIHAGGAAGIQERVLDVHVLGQWLILRGVALLGGHDSQGEGGGIRVMAGSLRLETCLLAANATTGTGGALSAMGLDTEARTEILDSWIRDNQSDSFAVVTRSLLLQRSTVSGNFYPHGPAVYTWGLATELRQATISDHLSDNGWGGLAIAVQTGTIDGSTIVDNGGVGILVGTDLTNVTLRNTIVGDGCGGAALPTTLGGNLESPADSCGLGAGDLVSVPDPLLRDLARSGGLAAVRKPFHNSPAVDQAIADAGCATADQRHAPRPREAHAHNGSGPCDIGAVELAGPAELFLEGFETGYFSAWSATIH